MHLGYIRSGKGKHVQLQASLNGIDLALSGSSTHLRGDSRSALAGEAERQEDAPHANPQTHGTQKVGEIDLYGVKPSFETGKLAHSCWPNILPSSSSSLKISAYCWPKNCLVAAPHGLTGVTACSLGLYGLGQA